MLRPYKLFWPEIVSLNERNLVTLTKKVSGSPNFCFDLIDLTSKIEFSPVLWLWKIHRFEEKGFFFFDKKEFMGFLAKSSLISKCTREAFCNMYAPVYIPEFFQMSRRRILSIPKPEYVSASSIVATLCRLVNPSVSPARQPRGCGFVWNPPRPGIHTQGWSSFVSRRPSTGPSGKPSRANTYCTLRSAKES